MFCLKHSYIDKCDWACKNRTYMLIKFFEMELVYYKQRLRKALFSEFVQTCLIFTYPITPHNVLITVIAFWEIV